MPRPTLWNPINQREREQQRTWGRHIAGPWHQLDKRTTRSRLRTSHGCTESLVTSHQSILTSVKSHHLQTGDKKRSRVGKKFYATPWHSSTRNRLRNVSPVYRNLWCRLSDSGTGVLKATGYSGFITLHAPRSPSRLLCCCCCNIISVHLFHNMIFNY